MERTRTLLGRPESRGCELEPLPKILGLGLLHCTYNHDCFPAPKTALEPLPSCPYFALPALS